MLKTEEANILVNAAVIDDVIGIAMLAVVSSPSVAEPVFGISEVIFRLIQGLII